MPRYAQTLGAWPLPIGLAAGVGAWLVAQVLGAQQSVMIGALAGVTLASVGQIWRERSALKERVANSEQLLAEERARTADLTQRLEGSQGLSDQVIECNNDCLKILDADGRLLFINGRGVELMEIENPASVLSHRYLDMFSGVDQQSARAAFATAKGGRIVRFRAFCSTAKGTPRWWNITMAPVGPGDEKILVISRDITEHMQVEKALRESEEAFRKIFEEGPVATVLGDRNFRVEKVNNAFCRMLGYSEKEIVGKRLSYLTHPDAEQINELQVERLLKGEVSSLQMQMQYMTRRQQSVWGHLTVSLIRDPEGRPRYTVAMIENIDERIQAQEQLLNYQEQLQTLASKLSLSEERERRRIATHLHDRIGQSLAFAKLKLSALVKSGNSLPESLEEIRDLIEQTIADARSLTFELSPPVLYELGLVAALEWLARKIQQEHGISTRFHDDGQLKVVDEDIRIVLFQAVRELLVNVVKHAKATHAQVLLRRDSDALRIIIEDDGVGFDPASMQSGSDGSGFGLFSVRERLDYLGGRVKIRSEPGMGTRITLLAPLKITDEPALNYEHTHFAR